MKIKSVMNKSQAKGRLNSRLYIRTQKSFLLISMNEFDPQRSAAKIRD